MKSKTRFFTTTGKLVISFIMVISMLIAIVVTNNIYKERKLDQEFFKTLDSFDNSTFKGGK